MKIIALFVFLTANLAFDADYPLVCRGGDNVLLAWELPGNTFGINEYQFVYIFKKSPVRAVYPYTNIPKGTCSWLDRTMRTNEIATLVIQSSPVPAKMKIHANTKKILFFASALDSRASDSEAKTKAFNKYFRDSGNEDKILRFRATSMPGSDNRLKITTLGL